MNDTILYVAQNSRGLIHDFFGMVSYPAERDAGYRLMLDAVLAGQAPELVLLVARGTDLQRGSVDQATGAMAALCDCLDALQSSGRSLHIADTAAWPRLAVLALRTPGEMRRALLCQVPPEETARTLGLLCAAAAACAPYLKRAEPVSPPEPPQAAPPPAVAVSVELKLPEGPLPVAIVSQPATRAVQTVERDSADEIVRTVTETAPLLEAP